MRTVITSIQNWDILRMMDSSWLENSSAPAINLLVWYTFFNNKNLLKFENLDNFRKPPVKAEKVSVKFLHLGLFNTIVWYHGRNSLAPKITQDNLHISTGSILPLILPSPTERQAFLQHCSQCIYFFRGQPRSLSFPLLGDRNYQIPRSNEFVVAWSKGWSLPIKGTFQSSSPMRNLIIGNTITYQNVWL